MTVPSSDGAVKVGNPPEAVVLFVERARSTDPAFELTERKCPCQVVILDKSVTLERGGAPDVVLLLLVMVRFGVLFTLLGTARVPPGGCRGPLRVRTRTWWIPPVAGRGTPQSDQRRTRDHGAADQDKRRQ